MFSDRSQTHTVDKLSNQQTSVQCLHFICKELAMFFCAASCTFPAKLLSNQNGDKAAKS